MIKQFQRRLAAVVSVDVVGYSRLMGLDEDGTLTALQGHRREVIDPLIQEYGGRIANTAGDSILMEFPSAVEAIRFAIAMQERLAECNSVIEPDRQVRFRAGINVGDVIPDGEDLLGDGINVAARLEGLAPAGGICLSRAVRDQVQDRLDFPLDDLGNIEVKNIARPVHAFRVTGLGDPEDDRISGGAAQLPSIAVLPFTNLSGDPEQEYFAEGIAEDIVTELARFPDLKVIARNSSFSYQGSDVEVQQISADLGARYVLQGSMRKDGNRVRVAGQLVDGRTGDTIWAERYDRDLTDIFEVQDEITKRVVANVPERVTVAELNRIQRKMPCDLSAYEFVLRGKQHHHKCTPEDNAKALKLLDKAIEVDPNYASAYAWKACTLGQAIGLGVGGDPSDLITLNFEAANRGLALDGNDIECHRILAEFGMALGEWDTAEAHHDQAYTLNPNDPRIMSQRGELLMRLGQADEALDWLTKTNQIDPQAASSRSHLLARANLVAREYSDAIAAYRRIARPRPDHLAELAGCYAMEGQTSEASATVSQVLAAQPDFTIAEYVSRQKFRRPADVDHLHDALARAGLPGARPQSVD